MKTLNRATPPASVAVGLELRAARLRAKFGVRELARRASLNPAQVSSWELGERIPSPDCVSFLMGLLQMPMAEHRRLRQLAKDAHRENHVEFEQSAAARLTAAYEKMASRIVEWAPASLPDRLRRPESIPARARPADEQAIRDLFVSGDTVSAQNDQLLWLLLAGQERIRLVTAEPGDLPAFTVYEIDGKTPTVALRHAHCNVYLTSDLGTAAYVAAIQRLSDEALSPAETANAIETARHSHGTGR